MYHHLAYHYDVIFEVDQHINPFLEGFVHVGGQAIDLGCGTGRLTQMMHNLGMKVTGVDLDETMIKVARLKHPDVTFQVKNILDAFEYPVYDLITCFGNTLPHLNRKELDRLFELISLHLSSRGKFIIQMLNYDVIMNDRPASLKTIEKEGVIFHRTYDYRKNHILFTTHLLINGIQSTGSTTLYPHQMADLTEMIEKHQLIPVFIGNDFTSPFDSKAPYLTLMVKKS